MTQEIHVLVVIMLQTQIKNSMNVEFVLIGMILISMIMVKIVVANVQQALLMHTMWMIVANVYYHLILTGTPV